ncbi:HNH endonuclease [Fibrella forsythiae]|uniref:HNH endonuclease n=1 Tax=Fibrella forsythiae TaxID=2817061 RepID=A0ABS3JLC7_9BACT|nr:HNH endonuclease [Fibrella forsythiae]MBO0950802.1 HNH endonuclease [Fibrella forsythiae]
MRQEVKIPDMKGNHTTDYTDADKLAPQGPRLDGNTWHHHQDMERMQEVPTDIHKDFTHKGGVSGTKKSKGVKLKKR